MKTVPSITLAITLGLGGACQNSHPDQHSFLPTCDSQTKLSPDAPDAPSGITPEDRVYGRSVLIQSDIDYVRRELTEKFGREQATDIFYDCHDENCFKDVSYLSDQLYQKVTKKEMDLCFQGGDINPECMEGTFFRRFGQEYITYMETKNRCNEIVVTCLDKAANPELDDEPYDPHLRDPLDPWNMEK